MTAAVAAARRAECWPAPAGLEGYSGARLLSLLQHLAGGLLDDEEICYLEIGVFRGLTLLSVANHLVRLGAEPPLCFGIDDFSHSDPEGRNRTAVSEAAERLGLHNVRLLDADYEEALRKLREHLEGRRIGLFFIDGPHDYRSQSMCLHRVRPFLAERCAIVIDDCNYPHVRLATRDFLEVEPHYKLVFEAYTPHHPQNVPAHERAWSGDGWWNGVHVLVNDPSGALAPQLPPVGHARRRCEEDHLLHQDRNGLNLASALRLLATAQEANPAGRLLDALERPLRRLGRRWWLPRLLSQLARFRRQTRGRVAPHARGNTYSGALPPLRIHEQLG